jgi:hypothetical protein
MTVKAGLLACAFQGYVPLIICSSLTYMKSKTQAAGQSLSWHEVELSTVL